MEKKAGIACTEETTAGEAEEKIATEIQKIEALNALILRLQLENEDLRAQLATIQSEQQPMEPPIVGFPSFRWVLGKLTLY